VSCQHEHITTFRFEDGRVAMWGCAECHRRFEPTREWQGLTGEEVAACWSTSAVETWKLFEMALKEKNNR